MGCRNVAAGSLTDRRSQALSPVDGPHIPGNHQIPQISQRTSNVSSEPGGELAAPRVHRQSIWNHRHNDGAPVSRAQPVVAVSVDPKTDYAFLIRALGGQVIDLGYTHRTLNPFHPGSPVGEPNSAGDSR